LLAIAVACCSDVAPMITIFPDAKIKLTSTSGVLYIAAGNFFNHFNG
jgi:hypothetical protein